MVRLGAVALIILAVLGSAGAYLDSMTRERLLMREAAVAQEFLESIIRTEKIGPETFQARGGSEGLKEFAAHINALRGTVRANVYSPDGFIRYSTEANLIGIKFHDNDELEEAAAGKLVTSIEESGAEEKSEQLGLTKPEGEGLIEIYMPLRDAQGKVLSVVEYYKHTGDFDALIAGERRGLVTALALAGLALVAGYAALAGRLRA